MLLAPRRVYHRHLRPTRGTGGWRCRLGGGRGSGMARGELSVVRPAPQGPFQLAWKCVFIGSAKLFDQPCGVQGWSKSLGRCCRPARRCNATPSGRQPVWGNPRCIVARATCLPASARSRRVVDRTNVLTHPAWFRVRLKVLYHRSVCHSSGRTCAGNSAKHNAWHSGTITGIGVQLLNTFEALLKKEAPPALTGIGVQLVTTP